MIKRIISIVLCLVVFAYSISVSAASSDLHYYSTGIGDWIFSNDSDSSRDGSLSRQAILAKADLTPCEDSPTGHHVYGLRGSGGFSSDNIAFSTSYYVCTYCNKRISDDFDAAYQDSVDSLPVKGIDSEGHQYWSPDHSYLQLQYSSINKYCSHSPYSSTEGTFNCTYNELLNVIHCTPLDGSNDFYIRNGDFYYYSNDIAPVTGTYVLQTKTALIYTSIKTSETYSSSSVYYLDSNNTLNAVAGSAFTDCARAFAGGNGRFLDLSYKYFVPVYKITPISGLINITNDTTYNTNTRTGSITGDYGIIGDNNQVTVVENQTIVNEAEGTYTNPATGRTLDLGSWSYDYGDRSYTLDLTDSEIPVTVRYGDDNVTIVEGDTTYEIYYIIQQEQVDPVTCDHDYSSTITTQPTCTLPGVRTYTCSLCGNSYTESISANGHTWQVKTSVQTEYDANGELVTQGYTIFRCSVCGEEYRSEDGTAPPGNSNISGDGDGTSLWSKLGEVLGTIFGGIFKFFVSFLEKVVDALKGLADIISGLFSSVLELFGGFTDFLVGVFPFLPEEFITILTLALVLLVAAGIIRRFLR